jgi:hypothetical protein
MKTPKRALAWLLALALAGALPAQAAVEPDFSDLWWSPEESGWGVNISQGDDAVMFATWFVYGANDQPIWYSATLFAWPPEPGVALSVYHGDLIETTGPWLARVPFDPGQVRRTVVGSATFKSRLPTLPPQSPFAFESTDRAVLAYTVGESTVTKHIQRQTLRARDLSGTYIGGLSGQASACQDPSQNGTTREVIGHLRVTQQGAAVTMADDQGCTYRATYRQSGQIGYLDAGTVSCANGTAAPFQGADVRVDRAGLTFRYYSAGTGCQVWGNAGGIRCDSCNPYLP